MRQIGDVIEFTISGDRYYYGIIEGLNPSENKYRLRFRRDRDTHHGYFYCTENEVRDVTQEGW